jgi:hypothetical protein
MGRQHPSRIRGQRNLGAGERAWAGSAVSATLLSCSFSRFKGPRTPHGRKAHRKNERPPEVRGGATAHTGLCSLGLVCRGLGSGPDGISRPGASPSTSNAFSIRTSSMVAPRVASALLGRRRLLSLSPWFCCSHESGGSFGSPRTRTALPPCPSSLEGSAKHSTKIRFASDLPERGCETMKAFSNLTSSSVAPRILRAFADTPRWMPPPAGAGAGSDIT